MTHKELEVLIRGMAPAIKDYVALQVARSRVASKNWSKRA